ncbi:Uncharacterized 2Fe-2 and 4Fe-4S clusters-containing protein, contains DUF4445 domain [Acetitomaculum ruminis DSM 5522]|uniref:Uncharacterized 2Fe-2 and 4Fe-4S clusters-containing protein, contains DUF4445 domain n=1 Tax=Acetitomaculum ruminis DSM 5522 TaxID=1120918 RepID=A0A1I1A1S5_9FIRM|nr:ASKHA domain-containing protein [Acetitomaculum ruminis]SFB31881.1 Uncharacterized 2Fe-2 and 4Fe-4S clusters-containing protein, contains DUF4445 domain [Acetitomaculum ruminis DSM 5522]
MKSITFKPDNITIQVKKGQTILEAARKAGIAIESPCNGSGVCGKCRINREQIDNIDALLIKKSVFSENNDDDSYILACNACINEDVIVELTNNKESDLKILSKGKIFAFEKKTLVKKEYYEKEDITKIYYNEKEIAFEKGNTKNENYGIVIDIGTTTMVASLVDLNTGKELTSESVLNPQAIHAQDVLSRITMAHEQKGMELLYTEVVKEFNNLIDMIAKNKGVDPNGIYEIILSGNTCMIHLATNKNPTSLGEYPYEPAIQGGSYEAAKLHGLHLAKEAVLYLPPIISSYVGPDITSGVLATQIYKRKDNSLLVDIGTNGEMVISKNGDLSATSTAAGPAFEGMNIEFGMRAAKGAIEMFEIEDDDTITVKTIENAPPVGICGSGLMDIVGELVSHKVITKSGKFANPKRNELPDFLSERLEKKNGKTVFKLSEDVYLTQKDVRQVQLAKGAVRAGIEFLLKSQELTADKLDEVMIAGSFGYHLRTKSLINIGLLPKEFEDKVDFVGNTSKTGGQAFLMNKKYRNEMEELVKTINIVELSNYDNFEEVFVKCLNF